MEGASFQTPTTSHSTGLSILYYNARSLLPKIDELAAIAESLQPTIICAVETWLSSEITDPEISIDGYNALRWDRNRHGGGVIFYIHSCVTAEPLLMRPCNLQFIAISILSSPHSSHKHCISLLYRPPSSPTVTFDDIFTVVHQLNPFSFSGFVLI